jgi:anion-transporting  ArsA/GET3 family ATPase
MATLRDTHRLVLVTGKGGVGKSVLAAAVAALSQAQGLSTVLVTLDTRDDRHPLLDVPLSYRPQSAPGGYAVSRVDAFQAAAEYARRNLPFGAFYEGFFTGRTFQDFAAAAPGFEELMCLGKLYNLAVESHFDRVVFDAPATGHLRELLAVPAVTQRAVRVGPLNHNARKIEDLLRNPDRCHVLVATLAEEMPVREALELVALCRDELRMSVGPVLVNRRVGRRFSDQELAAAAALEGQGALTADAAAALGAARDESELAAAQQAALEPLAARPWPTLQVPRVARSRFHGPALVAEVARHLSPVFEGGALLREQQSRAAAGVVPDPVTASAPAHTQLDLARLVREQRIVVCCGSGGVGKTTSAAALGVLAAQQGLRVQVMTIDPARRLAQAMGLDALGHEPRRVALQAPGELWAMMLDTKRTFDRLVETYAPDARVRDAIFANHYYQQLSTSLAGSRELVAMERVLEAAQSGEHDLLIVDTPPSQHALDFLDAPERIVNLLDGSLTRLLVRPYGLAARAQFNLFRQSSAAALKLMERLTGVQMLSDLSDFLLAFSSMFDGFKARSHRVQALLREPSTAFLLVCAPEPTSLKQVEQFAARLAREHMRTAGVLANRVHAPPSGLAGTASEAGGAATGRLELAVEELARLAQAGEPGFSDLPLPDRLAQAWQDALALHRADQRSLARLVGQGLALHTVPRLPRDPHSMVDLERFAGLLAPQP